MILTAALAYVLHSLDVYRLEDQQRNALTELADNDKKQCDADKKITEGVSHDYQAQLSNLSTQLANLKRVRPSRCVAVSVASPASGRNASPPTGQLPNPNAGVTSDALYDYAAEAERTRLQLIACQQFITETWKEKGQ
jgi:hypothetical protein